MDFKEYNQRDYYLAIMKKVNLKTMLIDAHVQHYGDLNSTKFDKTFFVKHYRNDLDKTLRDRIYAINLGDEPTSFSMDSTNSSITQFARLKEWTAFFNSNFPEKPTYTNLLPRYGLKSNDAYSDYLNLYAKSSNSPFVSFDHYPFRKNAFSGSYFYNLLSVKEKFRDKALWAVVFSALQKDSEIPNPDEKQLRFMAFCPIAYGAKAIMFFPYDNLSVSDFSLAINSDNIKYRAVKNINLYLKNIIAPVAIGYTNIATLHKSNTDKNLNYPFGDAELIEKYDGIVKDASNLSILIGVFSSKVRSPKTQSNWYYLWVVNKDATDVNNVKITLRGNYKNKVKFAPRVINYVNNATEKYSKASEIRYNPSLNTTVFIIPTIESGEGIMINVGL